MLKESLEKLDKDVMNLLTYSVKFVQPSIEFVSQDQGFKQKNKNQQTREKQATCELFYRLWFKKKTSYSAHIPLLGY